MTLYTQEKKQKVINMQVRCKIYLLLTAILKHRLQT